MQRHAQQSHQFHFPQFPSLVHSLYISHCSRTHTHTNEPQLLMDVWSWICDLPNSPDWSVDDPNTPLIFPLATSSSSNDQSLLLKAHRTSASDSDSSSSDPLLTFSITAQGFQTYTTPTSPSATLWVSATCPLSSSQPFLPLLLQLLNETISRAPNPPTSATCPRSQLRNLKPQPLAWLLGSHSPESVSAFFDLLLLARLFWLCVFDAPADIGSLYFNSLLGPHLDLSSSKHVVRNFLVSVGVDAELCFMRALGYTVTKLLILRDSGPGTGLGLKLLTGPSTKSYNFGYAVESHGLWILKGFAPVSSMTRSSTAGKSISKPSVYTLFEARGSAIRYALAHQQLEVVVQLEYSVHFNDNHIQVVARVNNMRFHLVKLGFVKDDEEGDFVDERYFVSRFRVWVGPEVGATYVGGLSLGRSTENPEGEVEIEKIVKGNLVNSPKAGNSDPTVRIRARSSRRRKVRDWWWGQDAEGNAAVFEGVMMRDKAGGGEGATWNGVGLGGRRGGLVFAGEEYGEGVVWRLNREMEGSVLKWRMGGKVWLSSCCGKDGKKIGGGFCEGKCVDWCEEVDLPLMVGK
ncbi:hypothetical protein Scep_020162 [Stephania cephalantha]|uniref:Uncharacterized protein n=1 Tax=Stephania cephalantha TaxID=152367 RepID=A0AAP0NMX0_9MAGN